MQVERILEEIYEISLEIHDKENCRFALTQLKKLHMYHGLVTQSQNDERRLALLSNPDNNRMDGIPKGRKDSEEFDVLEKFVVEEVILSSQVIGTNSGIAETGENST